MLEFLQIFYSVDADLKNTNARDPASPGSRLFFISSNESIKFIQFSEAFLVQAPQFDFDRFAMIFLNTFDTKKLFPIECTTCLIFDDSSLKEITFFFQIDHFAHPRERIFFLWEQNVKSNLLSTTICDES